MEPLYHFIFPRIIIFRMLMCQLGSNIILSLSNNNNHLMKAERKRKLEVQLDFAPEDIALATVPGLDFDPKTRTFDMEELRPQPIIKKRKKNAVPEEMKDDKYWEKRMKNKEATRRSREARRLKENQIVLRAAYLEKENKVLKQVYNWIITILSLGQLLTSFSLF